MALSDGCPARLADSCHAVSENQLLVASMAVLVEAEARCTDPKVVVAQIQDKFRSLIDGGLNFEPESSAAERASPDEFPFLKFRTAATQLSVFFLSETLSPKGTNFNEALSVWREVLSSLSELASFSSFIGQTFKETKRIRAWLVELVVFSWTGLDAGSEMCLIRQIESISETYWSRVFRTIHQLGVVRMDLEKIDSFTSAFVFPLAVFKPFRLSLYRTAFAAVQSNTFFIKLFQRSQRELPLLDDQVPPAIGANLPTLLCIIERVAELETMLLKLRPANTVQSRVVWSMNGGLSAGQWETIRADFTRVILSLNNVPSVQARLLLLFQQIHACLRLN